MTYASLYSLTKICQHFCKAIITDKEIIYTLYDVDNEKTGQYVEKLIKEKYKS